MSRAGVCVRREGAAFLLCCAAARHQPCPHPILPAGWAGLIINAINCLPAGELDGGRTFLGLFGRRAASRMGAGALSQEL